MTNANDILMGSPVPSASITEGVTVAGRITAIGDPYQEREYVKGEPGGGKPKTFPSGDPIMSFHLDLATNVRDASIEDDNGTRRLYMDGARIKRAVRDAIKAAGAPGLAVGGVLQITCTHYDTPGDVRSGKNYAVTYTPGAAANNVLMGQQQPAQAPEPQPVYQQPVQQYAPQQSVQQAPVFQQPAAPVPAPQPVAPAPAQNPWTPEQIAALQAAGVDPRTVFPTWQG